MDLINFEVSNMAHQQTHMESDRGNAALIHALRQVADGAIEKERALVRLAEELSIRCNDSTACCSILLTGTSRMFGRATASQIASASSLLFVFTYRLTNCGAISRTVCPKPSNFRAQ